MYELNCQGPFLRAFAYEKAGRLKVNVAVLKL